MMDFTVFKQMLQFAKKKKKADRHFKSKEAKRKYEAYKHMHICKK